MIKHTFEYLDGTKDRAVRKTKTMNLTYKSAVRYHCLDCSGGAKSEVRQCPIKTCPLYPFRPFKSKNYG